MWFWIYRLIAALLALAGTALVSLLARVLGDGAHRIAIAIGPGLVVLTGLLAALLFAAAFLIVARPIDRRPTLG
jgi:hypothetical protein